MGVAFKNAALAFGEFVRSVVDWIVVICRSPNFTQLLKAAEMQNALNEAPPKVRHLAYHGRKYRTQKKNINRAMREYQKRRIQKSDRK